LIGIIAGIFNLRISFLIIAIIGIIVIVVVDASASKKIKLKFKRSASSLITSFSKEREKTYEH